MTKCYLCETSFQLTEKVFQKDLLYAQITIKRMTRWKDMVLTVITRNSNDEAVVLCKRCLVSVLSRCAQEVGKTNVPMILPVSSFGVFKTLRTSQVLVFIAIVL